MGLTGSSALGHSSATAATGIWISGGHFGWSIGFGAPWFGPHPFWFDPWWHHPHVAWWHHPHVLWWHGWHRPWSTIGLHRSPLVWHRHRLAPLRPVFWLAPPPVKFVPTHRVLRVHSPILHVVSVATPVHTPVPPPEDCARIVFWTTADTEYEFEVELPVLGSRTVRELALTLERDLALGHEVDLVAADGVMFRLDPDFVEDTAAFPCR